MRGRVGPKCRLSKKVNGLETKSELYFKSWSKTRHETNRLYKNWPLPTWRETGETTVTDMEEDRKNQQWTDRGTQEETRLNTERGNHKTRHSWGKRGRNTRATGEHNQTIRHTRETNDREEKHSSLISIPLLDSSFPSLASLPCVLAPPP